MAVTIGKRLDNAVLELKHIITTQIDDGMCDPDSLNAINNEINTIFNIPWAFLIGRDTYSRTLKELTSEQWQFLFKQVDNKITTLRNLIPKEISHDAISYQQEGVADTDISQEPIMEECEQTSQLSPQEGIPDVLIILVNNLINLRNEIKNNPPPPDNSEVNQPKSNDNDPSEDLATLPLFNQSNLDLGEAAAVTLRCTSIFARIGFWCSGYQAGQSGHFSWFRGCFSSDYLSGYMWGSIGSPSSSCNSCSCDCSEDCCKCCGSSTVAAGGLGGSIGGSLGGSAEPVDICPPPDGGTSGAAPACPPTDDGGTSAHMATHSAQTTHNSLSSIFAQGSLSTPLYILKLSSWGFITIIVGLPATYNALKDIYKLVFATGASKPEKKNDARYDYECRKRKNAAINLSFEIILGGAGFALGWFIPFGGIVTAVFCAWIGMRIGRFLSEHYRKRAEVKAFSGIKNAAKYVPTFLELKSAQNQGHTPNIFAKHYDIIQQEKRKGINERSIIYQWKKSQGIFQIIKNIFLALIKKYLHSYDNYYKHTQAQKNALLSLKNLKAGVFEKVNFFEEKSVEYRCEAHPLVTSNTL